MYLLRAHVPVNACGVVAAGIPLSVNRADGSVGACTFFCATADSLAARAVPSAL